MKRCILFILSLISLHAYGQEITETVDSLVNSSSSLLEVRDTTDYASLYEQEYRKFLQLDDSLKFIKIVKKNLQSANSSLQNGINEKREQFNLKKEQLSRKEASKASSGILELESQRKNLSSSIDGLNSEITRLNKEISIIEGEISNLQHQKKELDTIKDGISNEILDKHESYLDLPFSEMSEDQLRQIKKECSGYTVDKKINAFVVKIDKMLKYKGLYEKAKAVSISKFNKLNIQSSISALSAMTDISELQEHEVSQVKKQLELFEEGTHVFKEFIVRLNAKRDGLSRYSPSDFKDDLPYILSGLEEKIDNYIMNVPYLSQEYQKYMETIKANPMEHPVIEQEMLGL